MEMKLVWNDYQSQGLIKIYVFNVCVDTVPIFCEESL
jgi:hypothetical protein